MKTVNKRALFLDRDGTLNFDMGYTHIFNKEHIIEGSIDLIKYANSRGFRVIIMTNQSGIGRGMYTERVFHNYMDDFKNFFASQCAFIDDYFFAPYYKFSKNRKYRTGIELRKPNTGMFELAKQKHLLEFSKSIFVGDKFSDIEAGMNAEIASLVLLNPHAEATIRHERYIEVNKLKSVIGLPVW